MLGNVPAEGENLIANLVYPGADANRGSSLQLGLFTNASVSNSTTLSAITEPTGGGYARKTLVNANWTVTGNASAYALQTFTATGSAMTGSIYGYFIATTGTTPKLLAYEVDVSGPYTLAIGDSYDVTPNLSNS